MERIIEAIIVELAMAVVWAFNGLVRRRNRTAEAWSQIDVQLRRRDDLLPGLVATVKGYASHKSATFDPVPQPRTCAVSLFDTHPQIAERIAALERTAQGLSV